MSKSCFVKASHSIRQGITALAFSTVISGSIAAMAGDPLGIPVVPVEGAGRLGYFAEKVRAGKPVTIGYIGGSITQGTGASTHGACYYWQSQGELRHAITKRGGSDKSGARLAAVGGTGSEYGALRVGAALLDPGVDLLIVEFAVNDGDSEAASRGMEGIVRHAWRVNPKTAIVFLYTTAAGHVKDFYMQGKPQPAVPRHHAVARHYGIAEVHSGPVVAAGIQAGTYTSEAFFPDGTHPSDIGHGVYAKLLVDALLPTLDWKTPAGDPPALPSPLLDDDLAYANWKKPEPSAKTGEWTETKPGYHSYTGGWKATGPASMTVPVKGKKIGLVFWTSTGHIEIRGLGIEKQFNGISLNPSWVPAVIWVYDGAEQKEGFVTIDVTPAAAGETAVAFEGVICVCRD